MYTADLLCLNFCRPIREHHIPELMSVVTPLDVDAWAAALRTHPDQPYAKYIMDGLRQGFRVGFRHGSPLTSARENKKSAKLHPEAISKFLTDELSRGRMLGPFPLQAQVDIHINRVGVVPKGHNTGKFRMITDLSHPEGRSVNDGVDPELCSLSYLSVDEVARVVASLGTGTLLAKIDIESAYRLIPVHPQDRCLQGVRWEEKIYVDPMLPFGLRSAPKIFNAVADALEWYLRQQGIRYVFHYLDDFIIVGLPGSPECQEALDLLERVCRELSIPLAVHKRDGPTTCIVFLGIVIDTITGELRLPTEKLERLKALLRLWGSRRVCTRNELESLIGLLTHACKVVRSGRSFLRRMLNLLHHSQTRPGSSDKIRLNLEARADVAWWQEFVTLWNGVSFFPHPHRPVWEMASDASGSWGAGAWHGRAWFQVRWDDRFSNFSIACKEFIPILLACQTWGHQWRGCEVVCHCDNQVVVAGLRTRSSRDDMVMHLLRCLVFIEAQLGCYLRPEYVNTRDNHLADDLSRNRLPSFLSKVPTANHSPSPTSNHLLDLLLNRKADWVCPEWRRQFSAIFRTA